MSFLSRIAATLLVVIVTISPADAASDGDSLVFAIQKYQVEGNTLLAAEEVETTLSPFVGPERGFGDIRRAQEALQARYQTAGHGLVQVLLPEQELLQGIVILKVLEKRISNVEIRGASFFDEDNIRGSVPGLQPGLHVVPDAVSRSLRVANENPAKHLTVQLEPQNDGVKALVQVADQKPWKIATTLDNTGTSATGNTRLGLLFQHANLFNRDHVLSLQYSTSPEKMDQVSIFALGYRLPLYERGDSIDLYGAYSDVDSGRLTAGVLNLNVSGKGKVFGLRYNHNLSHIGDYEHRITYGVEHRAYQNNIDYSGLPLGHDITLHPVSLTYSGRLALSGLEMGGFVSGVRNIAGGSNGGRESFDLARAGSEPDYSVFRYGFDGRMALENDWQAAFSLNGQLSGDRLVSAEQFGLGGASSIRGFRERVAMDDEGIFYSVEVYTPEICQSAGIGNCRFLVFYDAGNLRRNDPLPGEQRSSHLASAGIGVRWNTGSAVSMRLDAGRVLDAELGQGQGDIRVHFLLGLSY